MIPSLAGEKRRSGKDSSRHRLMCSFLRGALSVWVWEQINPFLSKKKKEKKLAQSYQLGLPRHGCVYINRGVPWKRFQKAKFFAYFFLSCHCSVMGTVIVTDVVFTNGKTFLLLLLFLLKPTLCVNSAWTDASYSHNNSSGQLISLRWGLCTVNLRTVYLRCVTCKL